jgi:hypothetical protein
MKAIIFTLLTVLSFSVNAATVIEANVETVQFTCKMFGDADIKNNKKDILEGLKGLYGDNIVVFGISPEENQKWQDVCTFEVVDGKSFITGHEVKVYVVNIDQ